MMMMIDLINMMMIMIMMIDEDTRFDVLYVKLMAIDGTKIQKKSRVGKNLRLK